MAKKGGLGRGLDALFEDNSEMSAETAELRISQIEPNRGQPRRKFDEQALSELSESIAQHGVVQPLLVRPIGGGRYQIVAGERRWRASRMAGLQTVPAVIRELSDEQTMEIALIENLQREDLNAIEEAEGYKALIDKFGLTQEQVASRVGKSRPAISNAMRLLSLPDKITDKMRSGEISAGHGRALLAITDDELREKAVEMILSGASVRDIEKLSRKPAASPKKKKSPDIYYSEAEIAMSESLGRKVKIIPGRKKGVIQIEFYSKDDLKNIADMLDKQA